MVVMYNSNIIEKTAKNATKPINIDFFGQNIITFSVLFVLGGVYY